MKDTLIIALLIAFLVLCAKATTGAGLTISWELDGIPHQHVLRLK